MLYLISKTVIAVKVATVGGITVSLLKPRFKLDSRTTEKSLYTQNVNRSVNHLFNIHLEVNCISKFIFHLFYVVIVIIIHIHRNKDVHSIK